MNIRTLTISAVVQITFLAISVSAQVKPSHSYAHPNETVMATLETGRSVSNETAPALLSDETSRPRITRTSLPEPRLLKSTSSLTGLTQLYRVGIGDVLDIQLRDNPTDKSTLFTVFEGGMIDYPLIAKPISVAGLTAKEIANRLRQQIRVLDRPDVVVSVRDYASHNVTVNGFVNLPGTKVLRREAVPLYVVLAEASPLPEATRATILRSGQQFVSVELADASGTATLVIPGDVIKVSAMPLSPTQFFFSGGAVNSPGQKTYHSGLTLSQAVLASGDINETAGPMVKLSRQGADGRLITFTYNLTEIRAGKLPDPVLQPGDRVEVPSLR